MLKAIKFEMEIVQRLLGIQQRSSDRSHCRDVQPASVGELVATDEGAHASQLVVEQVATSFAKNTQTWLCTARKEVSVECTLK